jgi:hypothetical protein
MRSLVRALALVALILPALLRADIAVSPAGDDANDGTVDRPVRTLGRAQALARAQSRAGPGDITIALAGGVYRLAAPLVLDARDSGVPGHRVIWAAVPGAVPVISGGVPVRGWREVDPQRHLWVAPAPTGLADLRQLYVNGVRAHRTRGRLPVALRPTALGYEADSAALAAWRNPSDLEFVYTGGDAVWGEASCGAGPATEPRIPVASVRDRAIIMAQPAWNNSTRRVPWAGPGEARAAYLAGPAGVGSQPAYVENAFELLGPPGQWYFDRPARIIYYAPRPGEDLATADVEAPQLEALVVGAGTPDQPVHDLAFQGLQFAYATWRLPSTPEGFSEVRANTFITGPDGYRRQGLGDLYPGGTPPYGAWSRIPGNVTLACARRVDFVGDAFVHLGAAGLELGDGAQDDAVVGCIFTDISGNGLELGGIDQPEATGPMATRDNRVADNHLCDIGSEFHGAVAILVGYAQRTRIEHNQIDHVPYSGILVGWGGWPDIVGRPGVANFSRENRIVANLVFDHVLLLADGGGIVTEGRTGPDLAGGQKVLGNVIHDQFGSGHAIYSDHGAAFLTIQGNALWRTNDDNWGVPHPCFYDGGDGRGDDPLVVAGNFWQQIDRDTRARGLVLADNRLISALDQAPPELLEAAGLEPEYRAILEQRFGAKAPPEPPDRVVANPGDRYALITWNPPRFDGGAPVRSYTVTASGGPRITISAAQFQSEGYARVDRLRNGVACTFTVVADNANGLSASSIPSAPVIPTARPAGLPGPPSRVSVRAAGAMASLRIEAPYADGGRPVVAYLVTLGPSGRKVVIAGRAVVTQGLAVKGRSGRAVTAVIDGLGVGRTYTVEVAAVTAAGPGPSAKPLAVTVAP